MSTITADTNNKIKFMNKFFFYCASICASVLVVSCAKHEAVKVTNPLEETPSALNEIASYVNGAVDLNLCQQIKSKIDVIVPTGGEEGVLMAEILSENAQMSTGLLGTLQQAKVLPSTKSETDLFEYLADNDIQIYWPYSENWDGETLPVITFAPENEDQDWNWAYTQDGKEKVYVDEEYAKNHPVWVIDKRDIIPIVPVEADTLSKIYNTSFSSRIMAKNESVSIENDGLENTLFDIRDLPVNILIRDNPGGQYLTAKRKRYKKWFKYHYNALPAIFTTKQEDDGKTTSQTFYLTYVPLSGTYGIKTIFKGEDHYMVPGFYESSPNDYFLYSSSDKLAYSGEYCFNPCDDGYYYIESQLVGCDDPDNPTINNVWNYVLSAKDSRSCFGKYTRSTQQKYSIVPLEEFDVIKIEYHNDASAILTQIPDFITRWSSINNSSIDQTLSTNFGSSATKTSSFSNTVGVSLNVSSSFSVGVPCVLGGKIDVSATSSASRTWGKSETVADTRNYNFQLVVPAHSRVVATAQVTQYKMRVGYTTYLKGRTSGREVRLDGVWEGVDCTDILTSYTQYDLNTNEVINSITISGVPEKTVSL